MTTAGCVYNGIRQPIRMAATEILGIDGFDADQLFCALNEAADIDRIVKGLVNQETVDERLANFD